MESNMIECQQTKKLACKLKRLMNSIVIAIAILCCNSTTLAQNFNNNILHELKVVTSKNDSCLSFKTSWPTAVFDSMNRVIGYQQHVLINNDSLQKIISNNRDSINIVLLEMLKEDNICYSWTANLLLYYNTGIDAYCLFKYAPSDCDIWWKERRSSDILFWENFLQH